MSTSNATLLGKGRRSMLTLGSVHVVDSALTTLYPLRYMHVWNTRLTGMPIFTFRDTNVATATLSL